MAKMKFGTCPRAAALCRASSQVMFVVLSQSDVENCIPSELTPAPRGDQILREEKSKEVPLTSTHTHSHVQDKTGGDRGSKPGALTAHVRVTIHHAH
jgi:hypothetical protein